MGACMSSAGGIEKTEVDMAMRSEVERQIKEAKMKLGRQRKMLLLGSSDSGKSTVLKQMRLIYHVPFLPHEVETYRQLIFNNLTHGLKLLLDAMEGMDLEVSEDNAQHLDLISKAVYIRDGEPFPIAFHQPLKSLWADPSVQRVWGRGNEVAVPENLLYFFSCLDRLFDPTYQPTEQDILYCRDRTTGITEMSFSVRDLELLIVDVGGQKSERRKWFHCFEGVTCILFLVSLSGYDQCLVEDNDLNQMQDAISIWDSICSSRWSTNTLILLFLNKNDLFEKKVPTSNIKDFFPDFDGTVDDVQAGQQYFKQCFSKLAHGEKWSIGRVVRSYFTTAVDTVSMRTVMAAVEEMTVRIDLKGCIMI